MRAGLYSKGGILDNWIDTYLRRNMKEPGWLQRDLIKFLKSIQDYFFSCLCTTFDFYRYIFWGNGFQSNGSLPL